MTQGKAQVRAAREAVRLEQQKTDAEQKKLAAGLSTSYNVILVERDLFAAQLAEVQARDTYAKAKVALDQAMGVTLDTNRIDLGLGDPRNAAIAVFRSPFRFSRCPPYTGEDYATLGQNGDRNRIQQRHWEGDRRAVGAGRRERGSGGARR